MPGYQNQTSSHKEQVRSTLDTLAREGAQSMLISALEQEVEEFLGRARYARADGEGRGYRNGSGNPRKIALGCGTVELRAPRVRDTREPFSSKILPRYQRASDAIRALLPELYLQGLATGDFEPALRTLLGDAAPLSPASIVRLKEQWAQDYTAWKDRSLAAHQYAYLWADGRAARTPSEPKARGGSAAQEMGGRSPGTALQGEVPNHRKLRRLNGRGSERCGKGVLRGRQV